MTTATKGVRILNYDIICQLKSTSNCIAYKAENPKTKEKFIMKLIYRPLIHPNFIEFLKIDYKNYKNLNNPHLLKILKYQQLDQQGFLIYEFCEQGNLELFLKKSKFNLRIEQKLYIIHELLLSYKELFDLGYYNRDLKLHNILISKGMLKVGDFEHFMTSHSSLKKHFFEYMAPEELTKKSAVAKKPDKKDLWCLGIDIYYILFGELPFQGSSKLDINNQIKEKLLNQSPMKFFLISDKYYQYERCYNLLVKTLAYDPEKRANIEDLLNDELFKIIYEKPFFDEVTLEEKDDKEEEKENPGFVNSLFSEDTIQGANGSVVNCRGKIIKEYENMTLSQHGGNSGKKIGKINEKVNKKIWFFGCSFCND